MAPMMRPQKKVILLTMVSLVLFIALGLTLALFPLILPVSILLSCLWPS